MGKKKSMINSVQKGKEATKNLLLQKVTNSFANPSINI